MCDCKKNKLFCFFMLLSVLSLFAACGSSDDDDSSAENEGTQEQQEDQGIYQAQLTPLNVSAGGSPTGTGTIEISGDAVDANLVLRNAHSTVHGQHIFTGTSCPTAQNDANGDGYVDYQEAKVAAGFILIPLDNNLSAQASGGFFPSGSSYHYKEGTSLATMLVDLNADDPNPSDDVAKLVEGERLNLEGRVVIVQGVRGPTRLPSTVSGAGTITAQRVLPIACGKLVRVAEGEPVPVPVPVPTPNPPNPPEPNCPAQSEFSTRLSNDLLIAGVPCKGGETTETQNPDGPSTIHTCRKGQWLVTVDNENLCTSDGGCTEIFVFPIVTNLMRAEESNPPGQCTYNLRPVSPTNFEDRRDMRNHQIRFYLGRDPQVIPK